MPLSILVAEDTEDVRRVIARVLERHGYDVCEAANGEEAIRALQTVPFDLVITDILMPQRDGLETIMYLRKQMPRMKVLAISGAENQLFLANASGLGATEILPKPFTPDQLIAKIGELLGPPAQT